MPCYYFCISLSLPLFSKSFLPSSEKKSPFSSDFLPDQVVISFSRPVCCRALVSRCVSSFPFSLRASALCQLGLSLLFHFPICLLSAGWPPLTCSLALSMCVFSPGLTLCCYQTWPGCLANGSGLEHSSEALFVSVTVQLSLLSSTFSSSLVYRAISGMFGTFFC